MANDALGDIFSIESAAIVASAAWVLLVVRIWSGAPAMFSQWIEHRRARDAAKAADWDRIREERDIAREERDLVRDRWAECERISNERLGRAVIAEARQIALEEKLGTGIILPGTNEDKPTNGGSGAK